MIHSAVALTIALCMGSAPDQAPAPGEPELGPSNPPSAAERAPAPVPPSSAPVPPSPDPVPPSPDPVPPSPAPVPPSPAPGQAVPPAYPPAPGEPEPTTADSGVSVTAAPIAEAPEDEPVTVDVVELSEVGTEPPAPPATPPPAPPATGRGLLIAGGVVGGAGLVARLVTSISAARAARDDGTGSVDVMGVGAVFYTPLIATGLVLTGTAMGRLGHTDAHHELFHGRAPRMKRRAGLGWGLFGAGMLVWTATRLGSGRCGSERCAFRTLELGYYLSLAGTIPGIAIGSYASGYANYRRRKIHLAGLSAAPLISRDLRGVSLGARF